MEIWIFANGEIRDYQALKERIPNSAYLIGADGGLSHIVNLEKIPNIVIGDMDSIHENERLWLDKHQIEVFQLSTEKDETDLEFALYHSKDLMPDRIRIAGGLGGRTDQLLGNIFLLLNEDFKELDIRLEDGSEELFVIRSFAEIFGQSGDLISLIPLSSQVKGITTSGLKYALGDESLFQEKTRGISNVMLYKKASVLVKTGDLLCVHSRRKKGKGV